MGWNEDDVYGNPDKFGLIEVGALDEPDLSYEFHTLVVWKHEDGRVFYAEDSGCSCPSPFENHTSLDDLTLVTATSFDDFVEAVKAFAHETENHFDANRRWTHSTLKKDWPDPLAADKVGLISEVSKLVPRVDNSPEA